MNGETSGDQLTFPSGLIMGCESAVEDAWIDYNGHMNVAYYVLAFDRATDFFLDQIGLGESYLKSRNGSTFTAEMNVSYIREVHKDAPLFFTTQMIGFDQKRVHYYHEMYCGALPTDGMTLSEGSEPYLAAANECLSLHVDMGTRRVAPIPEDILVDLEALSNAQANLARPSRIGRIMATR